MNPADSAEEDLRRHKQRWLSQMDMANSAWDDAAKRRFDDLVGQPLAYEADSAIRATVELGRALASALRLISGG